MEPSEIERPSPLEQGDEREALLETFAQLKDDGLIKRMPKKSLTVEQLREKLLEFAEGGGGGPSAPSPPRSPKKAVSKKTKKPSSPLSRNIDADALVVEAGRKEREGGSKSTIRMVHSLYYGGLEAGSALASTAGYPEFEHLGKVAEANSKAIDPLLDEVAKELGVGELELPPPVQLALITGVMAGSCFISAHPELPPPVHGASRVLGGFLCLNLAAAGKQPAREG